MLRYNKIIGLPVLTLKDGKKAGVVYDVLYNMKRKLVQGILTINIARKNYVNIADIENAGDNIIVLTQNTTKNLNEKAYFKNDVLNGRDIINRRIFTHKGEDIGFISNIYFDFDTGSLDAFEIADGLIEDIISGRRIMPALGNISVREEGIFVTEEAVEEMLESKRGLEKLFLIK